MHFCEVNIFDFLCLQGTPSNQKNMCGVVKVTGAGGWGRPHLSSTTTTTTTTTTITTCRQYHHLCFCGHMPCAMSSVSLRCGLRTAHSASPPEWRARGHLPARKGEHARARTLLACLLAQLRRTPSSPSEPPSLHFCLSCSLPLGAYPVSHRTHCYQTHLHVSQVPLV